MALRGRPGAAIGRGGPDAAIGGPILRLVTRDFSTRRPGGGLGPPGGGRRRARACIMGASQASHAGHGHSDAGPGPGPHPSL